MVNSFSFCLFKKLFISPSIPNDNLSRYSIIGCRLLSFSTFHVSCHSFLAYEVAAEKSGDSFKGLTLYVTCYFLLLTSRLSLYPYLWPFEWKYVLVLAPLGLFCLELCASCTWMSIFFPRLGKFLVIFFRYAFRLFPSSPSGICTMQILRVPEVVAEVPYTALSFKTFFCCPNYVIFTILTFRSLIYSSVLIDPLLISSNIFFILVVIVFTSFLLCFLTFFF